MVIQVGDIVSVYRRPGIWVVTGRASEDQHWRIAKKDCDGLFRGVSVGHGDLTHLYRPNLALGRTLIRNGVEVLIVGKVDGHLRIDVPAVSSSTPSGENRVNLPPTSADVSAGDIVLENLQLFLTEAIA